MSAPPSPPAALEPLASPRVRIVDQLRTAAGSAAARPLRSLLTSAGTVLGVAALVATIGLTSTARAQISDVFGSLDTNEVAIMGTIGDDGTLVDTGGITRLRSRRGVTAVGEFYRLESQYTIARGPRDPRTAVVRVHAASHAITEELGIRTVWGHGISTGNERRADRVALVSNRVAEQIGLRRPSPGAAVLIGGQPFTVVGVFNDVDAHNELLLGIIVPASTGRLMEPSAEPRLLVRTAPGVAEAVATIAAKVLDPAMPERLTVIAAPQARQVRTQVDNSITNLMLLLAAVALAVSGLGIANTTLMAVVERAGEIGLRRAVGARRRHIAAQFVVESALLGGAGALAGVWLGSIIVVWASAAKGWAPVLEVWPLLVGPLAGAGVGVVAGLYPALRAARLEPAVVLKR